jgi:alpha-amylase/alpha-mannosidase (GH57 family)
MPTRYVCIHGHFYQPPRESPWLEVIERQDSAWPFHDWNERVHAECYGPNAAARILDASGRIDRIVNNYESISFNFGPTLLAWMEKAQPEVYRAILEADRVARERRGGPGSAIAQVYGHLILPLANDRDKHTQVRWGIRDFERRFGRRPRGMWLSETAVDVPTLEALAAHGIEFTILAPHQCRRVRPDDGPWQDVTGGRVDTRRPYRVLLPSGRTIAVFFYDGPISRAVAFERLLDDGAAFARRLTAGFDDRTEAQLVHIATDGETYGHHHRFGEMALAYAISVLSDDPHLRVTTYEEFIERHPPTWQAEIVEATSWSCAHGIERWRSNCGCRSGGPPYWTQEWRAPLRAALDWLRDQLIEVFEEEGGRLFADPWKARDDYVDVVLDRSEESVRRFFAKHARFPGEKPLGDDAIVRALELLEMQRHAMLMYTSCGWFFDDLSGLETVQILKYAARALQLAESLSGRSFEPDFLAKLASAPSNIPEFGDGRRIYEEKVRPSMVDLHKVGAHFAASSLFKDDRGNARIFAFDIDVYERDEVRTGQVRLAIGRIRVRSRVTWASEELAYAVVHLGDHNLSGGVRAWEGPVPHGAMKGELAAAFGRADIAEVLRAIERHFPGATFSLRALFKDEQKRILDDVLRSMLEGVERDYERIYAQFAPLMRYLASLAQPVPKALHQAAEYTLTARLRRELERGRDLDLDAAQAWVREARDAGVTLPLDELGVAVQRTIENLLETIQAHPDDREALALAARVAAFARAAGLRYDMGTSQRRFDAMRKSSWASRRASGAVSEEAEAWLRDFRRLGESLGVRVD